MPRPSSFYALPLEVQREVETRLLANGFSELIPICDELKARGHTIGKSSLGRFSLALKKKLRQQRPGARYQAIDKIKGPGA
jgi:hypothetical protein